MLLPRRLLASALSVTSAVAFKDTSPYFEFSNTPSTPPVHDGSIIRAESLQRSLAERLQSCSYDTYVVVSQPSVSMDDFSADASSAPRLRPWARNTTHVRGASSVLYHEVLGSLNEGDIVQQLKQDCAAVVEEWDGSAGYLPGASDAQPRVINIAFSAPTHSADSKSAHRGDELRENDALLHAVTSSLSTGYLRPYLVIYTTTPPSQDGSGHPPTHLYDNEDPFQQGLHLDLKRDYTERQQRSASLPLFETYEYFNTAIFAAILVSVILFLILYIGVSAVSGIEVSYFSFSKEMGPAAQKKQQQ